MSDLLTNLMDQPIYTPSESYGNAEDVSGFLNAHPEMNAIADVKKWRWKVKRIKEDGCRYLLLRATFTDSNHRFMVPAKISYSYIAACRGRVSKMYIEAIVELMIEHWQSLYKVWHGSAVAKKILMHHFNKSLKAGEPNDQP